MAHDKRTKLLVNPALQGELVLRVIVYWLACTAVMELLNLTWQIATGPEQPTFAAYFINHDWRAAGGRLLLASLLLVPIVWDMLSYSNRIAGPVFRIRAILRKVAQGSVVEPVVLRHGDYWHGLADDLNAALQRLAPQQISPNAAASEHDGPTADMQQNDATDVEGLIDKFSAVR